FARTKADSKPTSNESGTRVSITARRPSGYDCGFDARGAEEAIANHRMNALRRSHQFIAASARDIQPHSYDANNIAVIEDDNSIIMPPAAFDMNKRAVLFTPEADGYRVSPASIAFTNNFGTRLRGFLAIDGQPGSADNGYRDV